MGEKLDHPPVYIGNYSYQADEKDLASLAEKYGKFKAMEMKTGFCFVHYEDKRDAEDAVRALDGTEWGSPPRRLRVEFAKNDHNVRIREAARREAAAPNVTLFVAGFDPRGTRPEDLERPFEKVGRLVRCEIKKTFAFIEYAELEDAKEACKSLHGTRVGGREITVEYVVRGGGGGGGGGARRDAGGGDRGYGGGGRWEDNRGPRRDDRGSGGGGYDRRDDRGYDRREDRGYDRRDDRGRRDERRRSRSPDRRERRRSPSYDRRAARSPPRGRSPPRRAASPPRRAPRSRSADRGARSPPPRSPARDRTRSPMRDD